MIYNENRLPSKKRRALIEIPKLSMKLQFMSERIKQIRKKHDMTQKQLADKLFTNVSSISRIENGKEEIDAIRLGELAEIFHVPIDYFYDEKVDEIPLYYIDELTISDEEKVDILIPSKYPTDTVLAVEIDEEYYLMSQHHMDYKRDELIIKYRGDYYFCKYKGRYALNEVFTISTGKDIKINKNDIEYNVYTNLGKMIIVNP